MTNQFFYKSKGSADDFTPDVIEASSIQEAQAKLDTIYGITRDDKGKQTNGEMICVEFIDETEFDGLTALLNQVTEG